MMEYPSRPKFWASRFLRLLQKCCAANEIGIEACWLLTVIALVEDSKRYSGPVTFWTNQILPITGFSSWGRLDRARAKAVESGWLHYEVGKTRKIGKYWCLIPEHMLDVFDDTPIDALDHHQNGDDEPKADHQNGDANGDRVVMQTVIGCKSKRGQSVSQNGEPSIPIPNPVPKEKRPTRFAVSDMQTAEFVWSLILQLNPSHKTPNMESWANDIRLLRERDNRTDGQIRELFAWANNDEFWCRNVLSPGKLRKQWDKLTIERNTSTGRAKHDRPELAVQRQENAQASVFDAFRAAAAAQLSESGGATVANIGTSLFDEETSSVDKPPD